MEQKDKTAVTRPLDGPVTVKVTDPRKGLRASKTKYWMGVTRDAPFQNFRIGPHPFQMYSDFVQVGDTKEDKGQVLNNPPRGRLIAMTEDEFKLITDMVPRYWVKRYAPAKRGCLFYSEASPTGIPDEKDIEPIGRYLYMIPAESMNPGDMDPEGEPPTMVPRED